MSEAYDLHQNGAEVFWGEIPPNDHLLQIYETQSVFLDTLEGFTAGGLRAGDGVIVIATDAHLEQLEERIAARGLNLDDARFDGRYQSYRAEDVLSEFMVGGWPDEALFRTVVSGFIDRARGPGRKVRAFGEMVAVLWERGHHGATVRLEFLWHELCHTRGFSLLCAYPRIGFTGNSGDAIGELCALHSRVIPGARMPTPTRPRPRVS